MARRVFGLALFVFIISPVLALFSLGDVPDLPELELLASALSSVLLQSTLSTLGGFSLGVVGAMGLCALRNPRAAWWLQMFFLAPAWLPAIFVVLSIMSVTTGFMRFPFGLVGVVGVHVLINTGLLTVGIYRLLQNRLGGQAELAFIEGAGRWKFLRSVALPQLKQSLAVLALITFGFCLTSFSVPLLVGGARTSSLEIFIFQQIQSGGHLGRAVGIGLLEVALILLFTVLVAREQPAARSSDKRIDVLAWWPGLILPALLSAICVGGVFANSLLGWSSLSSSPEILQQVPSLLLNSFAIALLTGLLVQFLMTITVYVISVGALRRFLVGYTSPSLVLIGITLMMWGGDATPVTFLKIILGLALVFYPILYRWLLDASLIDLRGQVSVARVMGASWWRVFSQVTGPQVAKDVGWIGFLAALWAGGDFALSGLVARQDLTAAMLVDRLMTSYRLDQAAWLMLPLLLVSLTAGGLLWRLSHVIGRKFNSGLR
jgi:thiamine transport system permease protein